MKAVAVKFKKAVDLATKEAARMAAEALEKAEAALPEKAIKQVLRSWEFMAIIMATILGSVAAAVLISFGLGNIVP